MARVKEIALGRSHQMAVCRFARRELVARAQGVGRAGGIVLADGVGLGKTYEALGTVASLLSQRQHFRERRKKEAYRILVLVPPGLVSKWADELLLPDRFPRYLKSWGGQAQEAVARTFSDVVVLRRRKDLMGRSGELRYGIVELHGGLYIVNSNLLSKEGKKVTQIHKTRWDAIIVDEAHRIAADLLAWSPYTLLANKKTVTLLLTATPFQLSPQEMKGLLAATFGGFGDTKNRRVMQEEAGHLYNNNFFRRYRQSLSRYFETAHEEDARKAAGLRTEVGALLRPRIVRNQKSENRRYYLVDRSGHQSNLSRSPFKLGEAQLASVLSDGSLIELRAQEARAYLRTRERIADAASRRRATFTAGALRQLLSTWKQYQQSASWDKAQVPLPTGPHPKTNATVKLISRLLATEVRAAPDRGWLEKVLIFTTYVGAEHGKDRPRKEKAHGTAAALKRALTRSLRRRYARSRERLRRRISQRFVEVVDRPNSPLDLKERSRLRRILQRFAGSPSARILLAKEENLAREARELRRLLGTIPSPTKDEGGEGTEKGRRLRERRERRVQQILNRYSTRDLVARYDGATDPEERDRHLHGFNSPFAPLVLIASSVGQEGIDLQRYCRHVIHYDLEWNPAKLEQREGRVDRQGRMAKGPVNIYFLLCRGTYDERIMHVMINRFRWHHVLLASRSKLGAAPGEARETYAAPERIGRLALDLRPRRKP